MATETTYKRQEEVERLPSNESDLENGTSDRGDMVNGRADSGGRALDSLMWN